MSTLLIRQFSKDGHRVKHLALVRTDHQMPEDIETDYFPDCNIDSEENIKFFADYIETYNIEVLLNQYGNCGNESKLFLSNDHVLRISELHSDPALLLNYYYKYLKGCGGLKLFLIPFIPLLKYRYRKARENHLHFLIK